jgi:hypothetical protein
MKHTQATKDYLSEALMGNKNSLGYHHTTGAKNRIRQARQKRMAEIGYLNSKATRKKMSLAKLGKPSWNKGKKMSDACRAKMRAVALKRFANPEGHPHWKGGKSFEPYPSTFTRQLKLKIRTRDGFRCQLCGVLEQNYFQKLSVNHIDYDKSNCEESNLITLCRSCNARVNFDRPYWSKHFKEKMKIGLTV